MSTNHEWTYVNWDGQRISCIARRLADAFPEGRYDFWLTDSEPAGAEILRLAGQLDVQYRSMTAWQERALNAEAENKRLQELYYGSQKLVVYESKTEARIAELETENMRLRAGMAEAGRDFRAYVAHMSLRELALHMNNLLGIADRLHDLSSPSGAGAPADTSAPAPED